MMSLLKFSCIDVLSVDVQDNVESENTQVTDYLRDNLRKIQPKEQSAADLNSICYVAGYISQSIIKCNKCDSCKSLLSYCDDFSSISVPDFDDEISSDSFSRQLIEVDFQSLLKTHLMSVLFLTKFSLQFKKMMNLRHHFCHAKTMYLPFVLQLHILFVQTS